MAAEKCVVCLVAVMDRLWFHQIILFFSEPPSIRAVEDAKTLTQPLHPSKLPAQTQGISPHDKINIEKSDDLENESGTDNERPTGLNLVSAKGRCHVSSSKIYSLRLIKDGVSEIEGNYYSTSCPRAEQIIKEQVIALYHKHGNTAVSWIRNLFHDCVVKSCDASLLLESANGIESEKATSRSFGMRNFKYITTIKDALEEECPLTVSCADIVALSARDGAVMLGGPYIQMKTGRKDSKKSYAAEVENSIPNHNDTVAAVLSTFQAMGIDTQGTVALLGAHSVGRVHCVNLVQRLYPTVDPTLDPDYAEYLKARCPSPHPDPNAVLYSRNDRETPMVLDNMYYQNILSHKGLLVVDQQLVSDPNTYPFVEKMAVDNGYFHDQFAKALLILSENNPLSGDDGEVRKDCRYVNKN